MLSDMEMDGRSYQRCFKIPFQRGKDGRREGRRHDGRSWVWFPTRSFLWAVFMCLHRVFFLVPSAQRCATLDEMAVGVNATGVCLKVSEVEASLRTWRQLQPAPSTGKRMHGWRVVPVKSVRRSDHFLWCSVGALFGVEHGETLPQAGRAAGAPESSRGCSWEKMTADCSIDPDGGRSISFGLVTTASGEDGDGNNHK